MEIHRPIFLDHHSTTPVDPRVLEAMLPCFTEVYGNSGSVTHEYGRLASELAEQSRASIANGIGATTEEIVFTSGATESNNLALAGALPRLSRRGKHIVSLVTEHKAILDPLQRLKGQGFEVTSLDVQQQDDPAPGLIDLNRLQDAIRDDTVLVSIMAANNEIGVIQPMAKIAELCRERSVLFHSDATQAVGRIPVNVDEWGVDLMSFSAHKFYGPKGIGGLFVRRRDRRVRLDPQIVGGGQENGRRSGTLNLPGVVGMANALELAHQLMASETPRLCELRDHLFQQLASALPDVTLNGPSLVDPAVRLAGNLNCRFAGVEGESLLIKLKDDLAVSSGSACTSANPAPSHVLQAIGLTVDEARSSLRFGIGRHNTSAEIEFAAQKLIGAVQELRTTFKK